MLLGRNLAVSAVACLLWCLGCSRTEKPVITLAPTGLETEAATMVPHAEYANWSRFGIGTKVIRRKEVVSKEGKVIVTTELRLAEKSDTKVVVERQVTVERPNEPLEINPSETVDFPGLFPLPKGFTPEQFAKPSFKAKPTGFEKRTLFDRDYTATVFEWQDTNEAGPMTVKVWYCDAFPGRLIRQELNVIEHQVTNVEEVVTVEIKN